MQIEQTVRDREDADKAARRAKGDLDLEKERYDEQKKIYEEEFKKFNERRMARENPPPKKQVPTKKPQKEFKAPEQPKVAGKSEFEHKCLLEYLLKVAPKEFKVR